MKQKYEWFDIITVDVNDDLTGTTLMQDYYYWEGHRKQLW